jgi:hypothetical protein
VAIFNGLFQQLVFHCLLAQQTLQLFDLLHRRGQLRRGYNLFSCDNGGEAAFLLLLTPQEQLTGSNTMLTGDQRHGHSGLKALLNNGDFFLNVAPSALFWT